MFAFKSKPAKDDLFGLSLTDGDFLTESILLAAAMHPSPEETVLDIGMGTGVASLCLAARLPTVSIIGLEPHWDHLKIISENIEINHMRGRIQVFQCEFLTPPPRLAAGTFSHVMVNGFCLENVAFDQWMKFSLLMTRPLGTITCLIPMASLAHALHLCFGKLGEMKIFPIWPHKGEEAQFCILQGIKGTPSSFRLLSGLTLYAEANMPLSEAETILHHGQILKLT